MEVSMATDTLNFEIAHEEDLAANETLTVWMGRFPSGEPCLLYEVNEQGLRHYFYGTAEAAVLCDHTRAYYSVCYGFWQNAHDNGTADLVLVSLRNGEPPKACHDTQAECDAATQAYIDGNY
jgi:hypothetical protein